LVQADSGAKLSTRQFADVYGLGAYWSVTSSIALCGFAIRYSNRKEAAVCNALLFFTAASFEINNARASNKRISSKI